MFPFKIDMILIYGGYGWIGQKIVKILEDTQTSFKLSNIRVDHVKEVEDEILQTKPDNVLCVIGRTHGVFEGQFIPTIDYLETKGALKGNLQDNLFCPIALALICQKYSVHLTYLGTGCIFSSDLNQTVFTEEDEPNFFGSSYSIVKGYTDRLMHLFSNVLNVRIRMPISSDSSHRNFINKLINYKKICSIPNSMTVLDELLPILSDMMISKKTGTINLTNPGTIEHKDVLDMYKEIIDPSFTYELFSYEEQMQILKCERSNNELDCSKLLSTYNVLPIKESIRNILQKMKKNFD